MGGDRGAGAACEADLDGDVAAGGQGESGVDLLAGGERGVVHGAEDGAAAERRVANSSTPEASRRRRRCRPRGPPPRPQAPPPARPTPQAHLLAEVTAKRSGLAPRAGGDKPRSYIRSKDPESMASKFVDQLCLAAHPDPQRRVPSSAQLFRAAASATTVTLPPLRRRRRRWAARAEVGPTEWRSHRFSGRRADLATVGPICRSSARSGDHRPDLATIGLICRSSARFTVHRADLGTIGPIF